jgi:hypothetical protein
VRFNSLKLRARVFMTEIARDRGLTPEQLEDRIVPDLDLDARGGRVFDFGPRQFRFVLGPDLKPLLRDGAGKLKSDLPRPGARDDADKAAVAVAAWKLLKKQVREVARAQAYRLEQAMIAGRRWGVRELETFVVHHPLMINLARRVLWGVYDGHNRLVSAFRVTEDGTFADVEDRPWTLDPAAAVGVAHPLHLSEGQRAAWGQLLGDYEIIAPFPQLGRRVHTLQAGEETARELTRFGGREVPAVIFMGILKSHGWTGHGVWDRGGSQPAYSKRFPGQHATAWLATSRGAGDTFQVDRAYFSAGADAETDADPRNALPLGRVDPVAVSEVLGTLAVVTSKGV